MKSLLAKLIKFYILIFIIIIVFLNIFMLVLNKYAMPIVINYVNYETKKSSIEILRNTGLTKINRLLNKEDLYEVSKNDNGEVESIDFNIPMLNQALIIVAKETRSKLKEENDKDSIRFIPIGVASNNVLLNNTGIKVPVKIEYKGNVGLDLKTNVKPYGIDSALVEVYIRVEVTQITMIPFVQKEQKIVSNIPVLIKIIKGTRGEVLINKSDNYSLPIN